MSPQPRRAPRPAVSNGLYAASGNEYHEPVMVSNVGSFRAFVMAVEMSSGFEKSPRP